jgi:hypothetical protein
VPKVGLEPTPTCVDRILSPAPNLSDNQFEQEIRTEGRAEVPTVVPSSSEFAPTPDLSPELVNLVAVWPTLPQAIKAGILAMIEASTSQNHQASGG